MFMLLKPFTTFLKVKKIDIYNNVFKLHSKVTVMLLVLFSGLVSAKEYFGKPIDCICSTGISKDFAESICWILGTYTFRNSTGHITVLSHGTDSNKFYQRYYQWIVVILVLQATFFYIPAFMWKIWENGRLQQLCKSLNEPIHTNDDNEEKFKKKIIQYFLQDNKQIHRIYAMRFLICELLNFLTVIFNMILLEMIFTGFWKEYAPAIGAIFTREWDSWLRQTEVIFPKLAKCAFETIGSSGSLQKWDVLCLLSLNIVNEKIFAFLWIWLLLMFIVSTINIIYRCVLLSSAKFRIQLLRSIAMPLTYRQIYFVTNGGNFGNWFIMYQLGRNLNTNVFREIISELADLLKVQIKNNSDSSFSV